MRDRSSLHNKYHIAKILAMHRMQAINICAKTKPQNMVYELVLFEYWLKFNK